MPFEERNRRPQTSWIQYRYVLMLLGFFGTASLYAMRVNINVAMVVMVNQSALEAESSSDSCPMNGDEDGAGSPTPRKEDGPFNWDPYSQGIILGAFYYGYTITPIPGGRLAERFGAKWFFGVGILLTGLLGFLIPYAAFHWGVAGVIAVRILQGLGEGVTYPAMEAQLAHWLPVGQRTTGVALIHSGGYLGVVLGMVISGLLADSNIMGGWPSVFYAFGIWTIVWFVFWAMLISNRPEDHPWISQDEVNLIVNDLGQQKPTHAKSTPWKKIFSSPAVIAVGVAQFGANWLQYTIITELPFYLGTALHFNIKDNGLYSALPYLAAMFTAAISGPFADYLRRNGLMTATNVRNLFNGLALFGPSIMLLLVIPVAGCDGALSLALFVIAGALRGFAEASCLSAPVDIAPDYAGTIGGMAVCLGNTTGFLVPWITGLFIQNENSMTAWSYAFYLAAAIGCLTGLFYQLCSSAELQVWGLAPKTEQAEQPNDIHFSKTCEENSNAL